jgi:hypothetical protein
VDKEKQVERVLFQKKNAIIPDHHRKERKKGRKKAKHQEG